MEAQLLEVRCSIKVARIAHIVAALLIAGALGGCASLIQSLSGGQPIAALADPASNSGWIASADARTGSATTDGSWITRVYHGWAGPSSQM